MDSPVEVDLGSDQTNINLLNGAPRVADPSWGGSNYALQLGQVSDFLSNDDWKAGIQFASSAESTLIGTKHVTGTTIMGWFKPLGDRTNNPSPNTNTPSESDHFGAFGLFGLLRGDENMPGTDGHIVRVLLEMFNDKIAVVGRRLDNQAGSSVLLTKDPWDLVLVPNEWNYLTATFDFDQNTMVLYKNGLSVETDRLNIGNWQVTSGVDYTSNVAAGGIKIGGSYPDNSMEHNPFNGIVDELMVFNQGLTAAEVMAQYKLVSGLPGDLDGDQDVDGADFLQVQRENLELLTSWQELYGFGNSNSGLHGGSQPSLAVPEPTAFCLLAFAFVLLTSSRRCFTDRRSWAC